ncbi:VOC family protein [Paractinoplanes brasiliensis]|uniref:Glyoxalase/bleomycin resistance protein/dioxygenase superfamily protein n=1 Tax=Paractinoplanes brasiliensis TaxID=52695 RepID=A0A4R6JB59_9ACTN|nr:VOC family protein [Actinoplanes brasiliensis]TDO31706.1 glyoxalase/bleomycin resistance protein/dioxygenase superfamily protein [Actinoplanes brasiliensis]GID30700.1 glyoxalase [Actinoplanes brasiliensis]
MNLTSIRLLTTDVDRLTAFYELITGVTAQRPAPVFAQIATPGATLAIGATATMPFLDTAALPAGPAIVEFQVDDVDAEFARLREDLTDVVLEPATMPWGNRSLVVRDPDGNLVNLFTPPVAG